MISSFQVTYNIRLRYFKNHAVYVCSQKNGILEVAATACTSSSSSILLPVTTIILETEGPQVRASSESLRCVLEHEH